MDKIIDIIDEEINSSKKIIKPIYVHLVKDKFKYKGFYNSKLEGEYLLSSENLENVTVQVSWNNGIVEVSGVDSEKKDLDAFLLKDTTTILKSVKDKLSRTSLPFKPSFLIGPPGTGKTSVIKESIEKSIKSQRILVLSNTHMAVENIFERLDFESLNFDDGDIILNINTENESLKAYSSVSIGKRKIEQLEDELEILKISKNELLKKRRDIETIISSFESQEESNNIQKNNLHKDISELQTKIKEEKKTLKSFEKRLSLVESNSLIKNLSKMFSIENIKIDELEKLIKHSKFIIDNVKDQLFKKQENLKIVEKKIEAVEIDFEKEKKIQEEILFAMDTVNKRLNSIELEKEQLSSENLFKNAKLVGATLVSAATNRKLQLGDFDKIIIEEASMALFAYILSSSQCLNQNLLKNVDIEENPKLTYAQNEGVKLLANSKIALVGDPKQRATC